MTQIRKSQQTHPVSNGEATRFETPATVVHIGEYVNHSSRTLLTRRDSTQAWTKHMHSGYSQDRRELEEFSRYQYVK